MNKEGRGRLSSIDMLPEEAEPDVAWAVEELRRHDRLQKDVLEEFNARIADKGITPISKSAFNRFSMRKAQAFRRMDELRRISKDLTETLGPDGADDVTIMIGETIKTLIFEIMERGSISTKGAMELSRALKDTVFAMNLSTEHRRRIEVDYKKRVSKAIDQVAKVNGLTEVTVGAVKSEILGLNLDQPAEPEGNG